MYCSKTSVPLKLYFRSKSIYRVCSLGYRNFLFCLIPFFGFALRIHFFQILCYYVCYYVFIIWNKFFKRIFKGFALLDKTIYVIYDENKISTTLGSKNDEILKILQLLINRLYLHLCKSYHQFFWSFLKDFFNSSLYYYFEFYETPPCTSNWNLRRQVR